MAGKVTQAIATMRAIGVDFPEFKDEIEEAIKNIGE